MDKDKTPNEDNPLSGGRKKYPKPTTGLRLDFKGEVYFDHFAVMVPFCVRRKSLERYCKLYGFKSSRIGQRRYFSESALLQLFDDHEKP